jgi:hypothetical protein
MKVQNFFWFILMDILLLFYCGCGDEAYVPERPTAASAWQSASSDVEAKNDIMTVTVLGETKCPGAAQSVINNKFNTALNEGSIKEKALSFADVGINAVHFGDCDTAKKALDNAIAIMDSKITNKEMLEEVMSLSGSEKDKIFKGEPHEKAVCYFYRGLIYLSDGDFENARACFVNGEIQTDKYTDNEAVRGNWLSLRYLRALADIFDGRVTGVQFPEEIPEDLAIGPYHQGDDSLLVVVTGYAPIKVQNTVEQSEYGLGYVNNESQVETVSLYKISEQDGSSANDNGTSGPFKLLSLTHPSEDLYVQAVSRGRRNMDEVLKAKKAQADQSTKNAKTWESIAHGASQAGIYGLPVVGISMLMGGAEKDKAASADSVGDLRQISSLPGNIYLASFKSSYKFMIEAVNRNGSIDRSDFFSINNTNSGKINTILIRIYN